MVFLWNFSRLMSADPSFVRTLCMPLPCAGSYLGSFLLSLEIQIMNFVYKKIAVWTTERENHRTDTIFEDTLIAKLAVFQVLHEPGLLQYSSIILRYLLNTNISTLQHGVKLMKEVSYNVQHNASTYTV